MTSGTGQQRPAVPRLDDGVVAVRAVRPSDIEAAFEHGTDPLMRAWTRVPDPYTRQDAADFLTSRAEGWRLGTEYGFVVESEGRFAGTLDLRPRGLGLAEIGFAATAWARGRSVMSRAVRLGLGWAFDELGYDAVRWRAQVGNWPSRRLAWATGFRHEGTVRSLLEHRGRRVDGWVATLRRGEPLRPLQPWWEPVQLDGTGSRTGVLLRAHRDDDAARMVEACRDEASRFWLTDLPDDYSLGDAVQHLSHTREQAALGRAVFWAVADPQDDRLLGEVMIAARDEGRTLGEIGYWVHPDARGRGVVTAAGRLAVRHALLPAEDGGLGLERVLLRAADGNTASQRTALRLGFTRTGIDRNGSRLRDGSFADDVRYDLLADELPSVRG